VKLKVLGASGGIVGGGATTSFLLDSHILLDGGTGVGALSLEQMCAIDSLLLTHAHLDHIAGAALMLASTIDYRRVPLTIYAPETVIETLRAHLFNWKLWPDFAVLPSEETPVLRYQAIDEQARFDLAGMQVESIPLNHTIPSFAYILSKGDSSFCFCGDTATTETLWQRINQRGGVDQLFIELSYPESKAEIAAIAGHYDTASLAEDLKRLGGPLRLNLMHAKPGYETLLQQAVAQISGLEKLSVHHCNLGDSFEVL